MAAPKCFCFMPIATVATCSAAQTNAHTHAHTYTHTCVCAWHVELLGWLVLMRLEFCRVRLLWEKLKISSGPQVVSRICIKRMQPARKSGEEREVDREREAEASFPFSLPSGSSSRCLPPSHTALKASPQHTSTLTIRWAVSLCFSSASAASSLPASSSSVSACVASSAFGLRRRLLTGGLRFNGCPSKRANCCRYRLTSAD